MTSAVLLYLGGVARAWRRAGIGRGISWGRAIAGSLGFIALGIALSPPLEALSALLFSAHMAQHLLLVLVAAPLLVAGVPLLALLWLLPSGRRRTVTMTLKRSRAGGLLWMSATHPVVAWSAFVLLLWLWHLPSVYEAALTRGSVHVIEHASLTGAAMLFWWVLLQPLGRRRLAPIAAPLFLFLATLQGGVLGAMITLSPEPWYDQYRRIAQVQGYSAATDQQLAGLLMWIPPSAVYLGVASWMLYRSLTASRAGHGLSDPRPAARLNALLALGVGLSMLGAAAVKRTLT
ncbi:MAG TPA: cytochrome c oxidase assembly protein [Trueperaceae bacterium]